MNCKEAEKFILLEDSGELGSKKSRALVEHLSGCKPCRNFKALMFGAKTECGAQEEPSAKIVQDVLRIARIEAPERRKALFFGWKPAMATAASFLFIMGLMMTANMKSTDKVGMQLMVTETQLMESEDQVVSVMYEGLSEDDLAFNFLMTYESDT